MGAKQTGRHYGRRRDGDGAWRDAQRDGKRADASAPGPRSAELVKGSPPARAAVNGAFAVGPSFLSPSLGRLPE